jgi:hypothetical protein
MTLLDALVSQPTDLLHAALGVAIAVGAALNATIAKAVSKWLEKRDGQDPESSIAREISLLRAVLLDVMGRLKDHSELDNADTKEVLSEIRRLNDGVQRIEVAQARLRRSPKDSV